MRERSRSPDSPRGLSPAAVVDAVPRCRYGHPAMKCKKLKPWQASLTGRKCALCEVVINRNEFRWRCEFHCPWDMCHHCYEKHWDNVIQEGTRLQDRQRRLALLSAVPIERRKRKDFEAAFGEKKRDAKLLLPPQPQRVYPASDFTANSDLQSSSNPDGMLPDRHDTSESVELLCPQGHQIRKKKKLKAWQDMMHGDKPCMECNEQIGRDDFRWRCEHHCDYNICDPCYEQHWQEVFAMVHRIRDEQRCWQMLGAVPLHLRDSQEFHAAQARVVRRSLKEERGGETKKQQEAKAAAAVAAYGTEAGPKDVKGNVQGALKSFEQKLQDQPISEAAFWVMLAASVGRLDLSTMRNVEGPARGPSDQPPDLPDPFIMEGLSWLLVSVIFRVVLWAARRWQEKPGELPPAPAPPPGVPDFTPGGPRNGERRRRRSRSRRGRRRVADRRALEDNNELSVYLVLGLMLGLEKGMEATVRRRAPLAAQCELLGLEPLAMLLAGIVAATEGPREMRLVLAVGLASVGGLLVTPGGLQDLSGDLSVVPLACLSQLLAAMRWAFINNILPPEDFTPTERLSQALVLATNIAAPCGIAALELGALTDLPGYLSILELRRPGWVFLQLFLVGVFQGAGLLACLNIARLASFPMIGILPVMAAAAALLGDLANGARLDVEPSAINYVGVLLCAAAAGCYYQARREQALRPAESQEDYQQLEDDEDDGSAEDSAAP